MGHFYTGEAFDLSFQTDYVTGKITPCRFLKEDFEFRAFVIRNLDGSLTFFGIEGKISVKDAGWNDETSCEGTISVGCYCDCSSHVCSSDLLGIVDADGQADHGAVVFHPGR